MYSEIQHSQNPFQSFLPQAYSLSSPLSRNSIFIRPLIYDPQSFTRKEKKTFIQSLSLLNTPYYRSNSRNSQCHRLQAYSILKLLALIKCQYLPKQAELKLDLQVSQAGESERRERENERHLGETFEIGLAWRHQVFLEECLIDARALDGMDTSEVKPLW